MNKTPISILQEMMVKKQTLPNYELIHDGGGTHINTFTYRVTCDGLTATGMGRSKKDAKHEAAKAMLETIATHRGYPQLPASPAQSPVRTPLPPTVPEVPRIPPNVPFVNAVGVLQELCTENNLQEPEYIQISDVGPPHAKIFTIQCKVTTFKETGVARTKKQAKQDAAKKMLDKLTDLVPTLNLATDVNTQLKDMQQQEDMSIQMAKARYPALSRLPLTKKINLGVKLSEYHVQLKNCFDDDICKDLIERLESIIPNDHSEISMTLVDNLCAKLKDVLSSIGLDMSKQLLESKSSTVHIVAVKINTSPNVVQIAVGETKIQAEFYAILKLINAIILLLK